MQPLSLPHTRLSPFTATGTSSSASSHRPLLTILIKPAARDPFCAELTFCVILNNVFYCRPPGTQADSSIPSTFSIALSSCLSGTTSSDSITWSRRRGSPARAANCRWVSPLFIRQNRIHSPRVFGSPVIGFWVRRCPASGSRSALICRCAIPNSADERDLSRGLASLSFNSV